MNKLKQCWERGVEPFLFFGELTAHRIDRKPLTESDQIFIRMNKNKIINEIKNLSSGKRIEGEEFFGRSLMEAAKARAQKKEVVSCPQ